MSVLSAHARKAPGSFMVFGLIRVAKSLKQGFTGTVWRVTLCEGSVQPLGALEEPDTATVHDPAIGT
jgi:hypothetical protein